MTKKPVIFSNLISPSTTLQTKAGTGWIAPDKIKACQAMLDNNSYDFAPIGTAILDRLQTPIEKARDGKITRPHAHEKILECVMQLKANGTMFQYPIVTSLCAVVMSFLETIENLDDQALEIAQTLHNHLSLIFEKQVKKTTSAPAKAMEKEIKSICHAYFTGK